MHPFKQLATPGGALRETINNGHDGSWPSRGYGNEAFSGQYRTVGTLGAAPTAPRNIAILLELI
jgi:hypothetical protein